MFNYLHRKRKTIFYGTAAAALAAGLYAWYTSDGLGKKEQRALQASEEARRSHATLLELVKESTPSVEDTDEALGLATTPHPHFSRGTSKARLQNEEQALDQSMDSHFQYIQDVSTPQELDQLLPSLHATLIRLTDIRLLKQQQQQQQEGTAKGTAITAAEAAEQQLRSLARLCFCRALGACWLIPSMDLLVRLKLNLLGRHLFLQEKLGKLRAAASLRAATAVAAAGGSAAAVAAALPSQLTPQAIEIFLHCDWFASSGGAWVMDRVSEGVDAVLATLSFDAEVAPQELFQIMASMLRQIEAAMLRCPWGQGGAWEPSAAPGPAWAGADADPGQAQGTGTGSGMATGIAVGSGPAALAQNLAAAWKAHEGARREHRTSSSGTLMGVAPALPGLQGSFSEGRKSLFGGSTCGPGVNGGPGGSDLPPWGAMLAGPSGTAGIDVQAAWRQGPDVYQQAMASASMVEELHAELCSILATSRFNEAMRTSVQHTFRTAASNIYASFPAAAVPGTPAHSAGEAGAGGAGVVGVMPGSTAPSSTPASEIAAAQAAAPASVQAPTSRGFFSRYSTSGTGSNLQSSTSVPIAGQSSHPGNNRTRALKPSSSCVFGAVPSNPFFTSNAGLGIAKPPRPLARLLRTVQASGDQAFEQIKVVTKGIATLPSVMALSATAFACTAQLQI